MTARAPWTPAAVGRGLLLAGALDLAAVAALVVRHVAGPGAAPGGPSAPVLLTMAGVYLVAGAGLCHSRTDRILWAVVTAWMGAGAFLTVARLFDESTARSAEGVASALMAWLVLFTGLLPAWVLVGRRPPGEGSPARTGLVAGMAVAASVVALLA